MKLSTILLIILVILAAVLVFLYFYGKRIQDRQAEQMPAFEAAKQTISILTIDKKKIIVKEPIKGLGSYKVAVKLHPEVTGELLVHVVEEKK